MAELGGYLGLEFLPDPVATRLEALIDTATRLNVSLELGLDVADGKLADLALGAPAPPCRH